MGKPSNAHHVMPPLRVPTPSTIPSRLPKVDCLAVSRARGNMVIQDSVILKTPFDLCLRPTQPHPLPCRTLYLTGVPKEVLWNKVLKPVVEALYRLNFVDKTRFCEFS